jgi:hypothetical protein
MVGAVGAIGVIGYLFIPFGAGGTEGNPFLVGFDLRYLAPELALGLALLPLALPLRTGVRRGLLQGAFAVLLLAIELSRHALQPWPDEHGALLEGFALGGGVVLLVVVVEQRHRWQVSRAAIGAGLIVLVVGGAVLGRFAERRYLERRYAEATSPREAVYRWARSVRHARVALAGFVLHYPLYGPDLSNRVVYLGASQPHGGMVRYGTCRSWRQALRAGHYAYVVTSPLPLETDEPPEAGWTRSDPGATELLHQEGFSVVRLQKPPDPDSCA